MRVALLRQTLPLCLALLLGACDEKARAPGAGNTGAPTPNGFAARQKLDVAPEGLRLASPSGRYTLVILPTDQQRGSEVFRYYSFQVREGERTVLESRQYAGWFPLWFGWDAQDRVWVGSADVGVYWWERKPEGWTEGTWERDTPLAPPTDTAVWVSR